MYENNMAEGENDVILQTYVTFSPCIVPPLFFFFFLSFLYHTALSFNDLEKAFKNIVGKGENAVV